MKKPPVSGKMVASLLTLLALGSISSAWAGNALVLSTEAYPTAPHSQFVDAAITECFKRIGHDVDLRFLPSKRSIVEANAGTTDGIYLRVGNITHQYPNLMQVPESVTTIELAAFTKREDIRINGWESLLPYSVVWIRGWHICEDKLGLAQKVNRINRAEQLFLFLEKERADVAIFNREMGCYLLNIYGFHEIHPLSPSLGRHELFLYLHKKHANLVPLAASTLLQMKQDGTLKALKDRFDKEKNQCRP